MLIKLLLFNLLNGTVKKKRRGVSISPSSFFLATKCRECFGNIDNQQGCTTHTDIQTCVLIVQIIKKYNFQIKNYVNLNRVLNWVFNQ